MIHHQLEVSTQIFTAIEQWILFMFPKLEFLFILLFASKRKHLAIFLLATLLIFILSSFFFVAHSIQKDIEATLQQQADITVQKFQAGSTQFTPQKWIDEFLEIQGVNNVQGRIYGAHYYEPKEQYFMIVGVDFYDEQIVTSLKKLLGSLDVEKFLARKNMIIGNGVKEFFDTYHYFKYYTFRPPDRSKEKVYIYKTFPPQSDLLSNDMIIMDMQLARKILGIPHGYVSDIIVQVNNPKERQKVYEKILISHFNTRIITKEDIQKHFQKLFNYKGGVFLILYTIALLTFLLILYQRYTIVKETQIKEIAIFRSLGWSIDTLIWFKLTENFIIATTAYLSGITLAMVYVYVFDAPLLRAVFLGDSNLSSHAHFTPTLPLSDFIFVFAFFVIPFLLAVVIPLWQLSTKEISEVLR